MKYAGAGAALALVLALLAVWNSVFALASPGVLTVSFLDVGQGDAVFIESPTGAQVLIDGGKDRSVLRELGTVMNWFDRTIDMVIATHPDADHIGGLPEIFAQYDVAHVVQSDVLDDGSDFLALEGAVARESGTNIHTASRGQVFDLGGGAYLEILFPDRAVSAVETNTGSIAAMLVYGDTSFLFTGDSPQAIEKYLVSLDGTRLKSDVLKVGHHGSRTSSSELFVGFVRPKYAVLSYGCDNQYGHPHAEVLETLNKFEIDTIDTCTKGTIIFKTDGSALHIK